MWILLFSDVTLFRYNVSTILLPFEKRIELNSFPPPLESFLSLWFQKALKMKGLIELDVS